ncbi:MAG: serine/threonine protein kinase [Pyrinomonadaceae bacterium]
MPATNELLQEGRYRIKQEFPLNGKGSVYDAYDTVRDTNVVVKEIPVKLNKVTTPSQQEILKIAFTEQAKILTEITHDSLLNVHDYFSEIDRQYVVMESVDGDDLRVLMERNKSAFPVSDVSAWADQLLDALNYLHTYKIPIIHRNIRPGNIKLNSLGMIKLLAFGLADGSEISIDTTIGDETSGGGTINYSPLEQIWEGLDTASRKVITSKYDERSERILKEPLDARSDIYSLGATLYHLVTARQPVDALERVIEILDGKPDPLPSPDKIDSRIPPEISDVLMKAMEIKREYRFDSAAIMRQVLRTALVRFAEREADESREQEEAAEIIKLAEKNRKEQVVVPSGQKTVEAEPEQLSEMEQMKQELHEAEEHAVEAEKRILETPATGGLPVAASDAAEDDLLDILSTIEERIDVLPLVQEDLSVTQAVTEEFVESESPENIPANSADEAFIEVTESEVEVDEPEVHASFAPSIPEAVQQAEVGSYSSALFIDQSTEPEKSKGFPLSLPVIAIGFAVLCIAAIGIWMFTGSSPSEPAKTISTQSGATIETSTGSQSAELPNNLAVPADQNVSSQVAPDLVDTTSSIQPVTQTASSAQPSNEKVKKPAPTPAKAPARPKKTVTADDLINDN